MGASINQIFGVQDHVGDYLRQNESNHLSVVSKRRVKAEVLFKDGTKRIFPTRAIREEAALPEILHFVESMEQATGSSVAWRFAGKGDWMLGSNAIPEKKKSSFSFQRILDVFFDLED